MTLKQTQTIINSIMMQEIKKNELNTDFYSCCRIKYYNSNFFKQSIKNKEVDKTTKFRNLILPLKSGGFYSSKNNEIIVFLDKKDMIPGQVLPLAKLLEVTYHELYHAIQTKELDIPSKNMSYDLFASQCDIFICGIQTDNLLKYYFSKEGHDAQMFVILANLHGAIKTEEYLENNKIKINEADKKRIETKKQINQELYQNYNLTKRLNVIIDNYNECIKYDNFNTTIFDLFINKDGSVKDINISFSNGNVLNLDPKILLAFIKTNAIKKAISETTLTEETSLFFSKLLTNNSISASQELENVKVI